MINEKGIIKQYDVVVYPFYFVVAIGDVEKEINARYRPREEEFNWIAMPCGDNAACTFNIKSKKDGAFAVLVWYRSMDDFKGSTLTHECDHAALEIFYLTGAKVDYGNQEPYCYLAGTLSRFACITYTEYKDYLAENKKKNKTKKHEKEK